MKKFWLSVFSSFVLVFSLSVQALAASSVAPHELQLVEEVEISPEFQAALELVDFEELERRAAESGLGEGDQIMVQVNSKGEIVDLGASDIKLAGFGLSNIIGGMSLGTGIALFLAAPFAPAAYVYVTLCASAYFIIFGTRAAFWGLDDDLY